MYGVMFLSRNCRTWVTVETWPTRRDAYFDMAAMRRQFPHVPWTVESVG